MIFSWSSSLTFRILIDVSVTEAWNPFGPSLNIYSLLSISSMYMSLNSFSFYSYSFFL